MLQTIKNYIINLPCKSFGEFYQDYIVQCEDLVVDSDVAAAESEITSMCKIPELIANINMLSNSLRSG